MYPNKHKEIGDDDLLKAIRVSNLQYVFERFGNDLDRVEKWSEVLSVGEQQRVAFARIYLNRPRFAILDEVRFHSELLLLIAFCKGNGSM